MNDHDEGREREGEVCIEGRGWGARRLLAHSVTRHFVRLIESWILQQIGRLAARFNVAPLYPSRSEFKVRQNFLLGLEGVALC